jgi:hypothetical protein
MSGYSASSNGSSPQATTKPDTPTSEEVKKAVNNPEEKKQQSLSEFLCDVDPNQGVSEKQQLADFMKKYNFKSQAEALKKLQ